VTLPAFPSPDGADRAKGTLGPKPPDVARGAVIARIRRRASGLLVVAGVVFVIARVLESRWWWMGFIRATAEASLVGGLADWFAVTALFRQPLGLPIPHTAIVKRQKDRIARVLGTFVQNHFLTREVIAERLKALGIAQRIGEWLADPVNSRKVAGQLTQGVVRTVDALPAERWQGGLVDEGVKLMARAVESSEEAIAATLREQITAGMPRWTPAMVQEAIHKRVMAALERFLADLRTDRAHPARARLEVALREALDRFREAAERRGHGRRRHCVDDRARAQRRRASAHAECAPAQTRITATVADLSRSRAGSRRRASAGGPVADALNSRSAATYYIRQRHAASLLPPVSRRSEGAPRVRKKITVATAATSASTSHSDAVIDVSRKTIAMHESTGITAPPGMAKGTVPASCTPRRRSSHAPAAHAK
jgi:hypothetical protein